MNNESEWNSSYELKPLSRMAREMLVIVSLELPFFVPRAFAEDLGLGFWTAMGADSLLVTVLIGTWMLIAPQILSLMSEDDLQIRRG